MKLHFFGFAKGCKRKYRKNYPWREKIIRVIFRYAIGLALFFSCTSVFAKESPKIIEVGVAWEGKSAMAERILTGLKEVKAKRTPSIRLEIHRELPDMAALDSVIGYFEKNKSAMVILRSSGTELLASRGAAIPAFIGATNNPVELGAAISLKQPNPNITGVTYSLPIDLKLETFRQVYPGLKNYVLLVEADHPGSRIDDRQTRMAATKLGIQGKTVFCQSLDDAINAAKQARHDEVIILGVQALIMDNAYKITSNARNNFIFSYSEQAMEQGALAGLVPDDNKLGQMLGQMLVDHLINDVPLERMPVQTDNEPTLKLNYPRLEQLQHKVPYAIMSLARSEQMLESILASASTGIYRVENQTIVYVNDYILQMLGYTREELIGKNSRTFYINDQEYEKVENEILYQLANKPTATGEFKWRHKDGSVRHVLLSTSAQPPIDFTGTFTVNVLDITEQKKAEAILARRTYLFYTGMALFIIILTVLVVRLLTTLRLRKAALNALHKSEAQFKNLFSNAADAILIADMKTGIITDANRAAERLIKRPATQIIGMHQSSLHPLHNEVYSKESFGRHTQELRSLGYSSPVENMMICADGSLVPIEVMSSFVNYQGKDCIMGTFRDISKRKQAEMKLFESEEMYRSLLQTVPDIIIRSDLEGNIIFINDVGIRALKSLSKEEILGRNIFSFIADRDKQRAAENTRLMLQGYLGVKEYKLILDEHNIMEAEVNGEITRDKDGNPNGMVYIIRDVTERKLAENERKQKELLEKKIEIAEISLRFKQNFLANMSHEIRTPLTGVLGMIEILEQTKLTHTQKEYLNTLKVSGENLRGIINQVLDYSKIEAGKIRINPTAFEFLSLQSNSEILYKNNIHQGVKFISQIDPNIPKYIKADSFRLSQVLNNLVSNALKFTTKGFVSIRSTLISSNPQKKQAVIKTEVTDTGIGIPVSLQKKLFTPFMQIDAADIREHEGTGLGLSISKQLIELMGGEIGVTSQEGKGSTFWFTFPATIVDSLPDSRADKPLSSNYPRLHILLAEDKEVTQKVVSLMLTSLGHTVEVAHNGKEVLQKYQPDKFDLILMDIQMPVMDGVSATQQLKKKYDHLPPIVGLSANAFEGDREKYMALGMDEYLTKPVKKVDFENLIAKLFRESPNPQNG